MPAQQELTSAPSLATLYPKALLAGLRPGGRGGSSLPDTELVRRGVTVDPAQLAEYNHVCGFRLDDALPVTYPHVLAFGQQVQLMSSPEFPFALPGLVHVANSITQHRPVRLDESFSLAVRAEGLRDHVKGTQFDLISELTPDGEDAPVWRDVSTYLRRGGSGSGAGKGEGAKRREPQLAAPSPGAIWQVPGDIGRRYAAVAGDINPIHMHPLSARLMGFPAAIAHGMWSKARVVAALEGRLPDAFRVDVRFKQPVLLPAKVALTTWAAPAGEPAGWDFELWNARKPKPHLEGGIRAV